jgi:tetratricopeptide (TPR) repeat protein
MNSYIKKLILVCLLLTICQSAFAEQLPEFTPNRAINTKCPMPVAPRDYRDNSYKAIEFKKKVEGAHFTDIVKRGISGVGGSLEAEFNYVLHMYPNHPQALLLMANNQMKVGYSPIQSQLRKGRYWPEKECYFKIAVTSLPPDPAVFHVIAIFYHQQNKLDIAKRNYDKALALAEQNPEIHYNAGLLYLDLGNASEALKHAKKAYASGYPLQGLKNRLIAQKVWN